MRVTSVHNTRSEAVMQRLGMRRDAATFLHPALPADHRLAEHCLYRIQASAWVWGGPRGPDW